MRSCSTTFEILDALPHKQKPEIETSLKYTPVDYLHIETYFASILWIAQAVDNFVNTHETCVDAGCGNSCRNLHTETSNN